MKLWAALSLTKTHLHILYILTFLFYEPANTSPCLNVGTVIFGQMDTLVCCLDHEKYATLVFRRLLNSVIAVPLQQVKGDAYICAFISFVHTSARTAAKSAPPTIARSFVSALFDVTGGYLHSYLLPVTREAFYAGNARFSEVRKLYALYHDIKDYLYTNGQGWTSPKGQYGIKQRVRSLDIESVEHEMSSCDNFLFNATGSSQDSSGFCVMPIPFFDNNKSPRSVALPLRYGTLHGLETPESAYIILGHYVRSLRCLRERKVSTASFIDYNKKFRSWIVKHVLPRLGDEQWYPAFGGILRVLKKTGECIHGQESSRTVRKVKIGETRRRRWSKNYFNTRNVVSNRGKDSLVNDVVNDLVPIDTDVLQKLMQPNSEAIVEETIDDTQVSLLPELIPFAETINEKLDEIRRLENSKDELNLISTSSHSPTFAEVNKLQNRLQFLSKRPRDNDTSVLIVSQNETAYTNSKLRSSTEAINNERDVGKGRHSKIYNAEKSEKPKEFKNIYLTKSETIHDDKIWNGNELRERNQYLSSQKHSTKSSTMDVKDKHLDEEYLEDQELKIKGFTTSRPRKIENELQNLDPKISFDRGTFKDITLEDKPQKIDSAPYNLKAASGMSLQKNELDIPQRATSHRNRNKNPITERIVKMKVPPMMDADPAIDELKYSLEELSHDINATTSKAKTTTFHPGKMHEQIRTLFDMTDFREITTKVPYISPFKKKSEFLVHPSIENTDEVTLTSSISPNISTKDLQNTVPWITYAMSSPPQQSFSNLTDGCVHRTWDGVHAPAPYVSRLLAEVLESPAFNLDFLVCHILLSLFVWLLFLCVSVDQYECSSPCILRIYRDKSDKMMEIRVGEEPAMPLLVQQTYYALDGGLPRVLEHKSFGGQSRGSLLSLPVIPIGHSKESRVKEETTHLTGHLTPQSSLVVSNKHQQHQLTKTLSTCAEAQAQSLGPKVKSHLELQSEDSEVLSEDEEWNQHTSKSAQ